MLSVRDQVQSQRLVCPVTHRPLAFAGELLITDDGSRSYPLIHGVPVLLPDAQKVAAYLGEESGRMVAEYQRPPRRSLVRSGYQRITEAFGDMRTRESEEALRASLEDLPDDALCVSVGGGPVRVHPALVNLNLAAFPNVDVVADAYSLPYAEGSVEAVHCEAVLEHLEFPQQAVAEMYRVLRPGRLAFAATPFLQVFHGYPNHFQNFTLAGHRRLFERAGFAVIAAGTCVGPTFALRDLLANYLAGVLPGGRIGKMISHLVSLLTLPLLWLDRIANLRPFSHGLASTTFLLARKSVEPA
ncbi:MAG TPA: methyltransferase domain-containing protein [Thermoanaerobaculia bacterium]|nr:methyltransferase domain-containing protein [Thermoanaerobaculia bacterium]